jgi:cytochrome c oxidase subunit 3
MDITMTSEHKARDSEIIQIDIVVCYGQHDHDVCRTHKCVRGANQSRVDWLKSFELPTAFYYSTLVILGCSVTGQKPFKDNKIATTTFLLLL